jgi:hypothetical protein
MISDRNDLPGLAVIGHLVYDRIVLRGGKTTQALGGISYNIAALTSMMECGRLLPVCEIGEDIRGVFAEVLGPSRVLDISAIEYTDLPNVVNTLVYDDSDQRQEWNSRKPRSLSLKGIPDDMDAVLFNFISGDDVELDELAAFRSRFDGIACCDFHSLALGRGPGGKRFFRRHPRWREYLSPVDVVQMNLAEFATIAGPLGDNVSEVASRIAVIHDCGPGIAIITMGRRGFVLSIDSGKKVHHIPAIEIPHEVDSTGCGDTLAASMMYYYALSGDILQAAVRANLRAAAKATFTGIDGFINLDTIINGLGPPVEPIRIT